MGSLRYLTAGESHGPALTVIVEGLPAGLSVSTERIARELARRRHGFGRGARMKLEIDDFDVLGGVRHGRTLGSPVSVVIRNTEFEDKWAEAMSPAPVAETPRTLTRPRPGHADLAGLLKYGLRDVRDVLERASARETAARTVAGTLAAALLDEIGVSIASHVTRIGEAVAPPGPLPAPEDADRIDSSEVRAMDPAAEEEMVAAISSAKSDGDTLGGVFEIVVWGLPPGLGSHVHWDRKIDARLAAGMISIQAMKAVGFGDGFDLAARRGSQAHDEILWSADEGYHRETDRAGGIEGGITTGAPLRISVAMKPLATLRRAMRTVDVESKEDAVALVERSDVCAVPRACVVGEAVVALVLADAALEKFGGDSMEEFVSTHRRWLEMLKKS